MNHKTAYLVQIVADASELLLRAAQSAHPQAEYQKVVLGQANASALHQAIGVQLAGFRVIVDTSAIQHTLKKHGRPDEALRGQKIIDAEDFRRLLRLLSEPDAVRLSGVTRVGRDVIAFERSEDGWIFRAAMEVRTGRRELALVSLYTLRKAKK